jgi:hypothetical protein
MRWKILPQNMSERGEDIEELQGRNSINAALLCAVREFHEIAQLWHSEDYADSPAGGSVAAKALHLHALNFALWHHEDAVRRPGADDHEVAVRKRRIDELNARRHAAIENVDVALLDQVELNSSAPLYTETPGAIVDRLSVLALRILHTNRATQSRAHLAVLNEQYDDLFSGLEGLLARMQSGEITFKLYRQFKSAAQRNYCDLFESRDA